MPLYIGIGGVAKSVKSLKVGTNGITANHIRGDIGINGVLRNWYWYAKNDINKFVSVQLFVRRYRLINLQTNKIVYEGTDVKSHLGNGIGGIIVNPINKSVEIYARYPYSITVFGENYLLTSDGDYLNLGNFGIAETSIGFKWAVCDINRYLGGATLASAGNFSGSKSLDTNSATFVCNYIGNSIKTNSSLGTANVRIGYANLTNNITLTVSPSSSSHSGKSNNHYSYLKAAIDNNRLYMCNSDQSIEVYRPVYLNIKLTNLM